MDTRTFTSDWALKIESESSDIQRAYSKNQLECGNKICVDGEFIETKNIYFTYRLDEGERYCWLRIPRCKDRITREESDGLRTFIYRWQPVNFAGIFDVILDIGTEDKKHKKYTLRLDVLSKFAEEGNDRSFLFMLNSIREKHLGIYDLFNPSKIQRKREINHRSILDEQFEVLERNMKKLENIVYQISLNPNKKLIKETQRDKLYALDIVDHNIIHDIATQRGGLIEVPKESVPNDLQEWFVANKETVCLPDSIIVYRTAPTFNVYENQLLKRFLTLITICAKLVETELEQEKSNNLEQNQFEELDKRIQKCKDFRRKAYYMTRYSFLDEVQETDNIAYHTPVLQREVNYMRFHEIFKEFIKGPLFDFSEVFNLPILDIPTLYEYWAVIEIVDILCDMKDTWNVNPPHIIEKNWLVPLFKLRSGNNSIIELSNNKRQVSLFYQKEYSTYTKECQTCEKRKVKPDITLEMRVNGALKILILDPKYRSSIDAGDINDPESAINKMHVYKDAIRGEDGAHIVEAAYVIFLGDTQINYPFQDNKDGIGGIRLFPKENETGIEVLKNIINKFIVSELDFMVS